MATEVSMCSSSGSPELTPEEERVFIRDIALAAESNVKEGCTFYLITQRWWQHWIEYVNQDQPNNINDGSSVSENCDSAGSTTLKRPGVIDNSDLIYESALEDSNMGIDIHDTLLEGRDYVLLPYEVWNQLFMWYGGGPTLPRKVISSGLSQTELAVEVYPLRLQLLLLPKEDQTTIRISKKETIGVLHRRACEIFDLETEQVRIWDYYGHRKHALMNDMDKTLDDANIQMDQDILVEFIDNTGTSGLMGRLGQENGSLGKEASLVLAESSKSNLAIPGGISVGKVSSKNCIPEISQSNLTTGLRESDSNHGVSGVHTRGSSGGLTGLLNLGNTCFMNSAIQCLVHTPEFAKYFREDYHQEINWQNPLGMVGELALAFGELLRKLWAPGRTPVAPRPFKAKLARFAPQFSGYNQHDSQELLAFLLDGLHEDLNRVKEKPYIKSRDADGRPDEEVADEYWANHIARNDSIIVDVCQGQYKSTLVCPVCDKISVTFDPFMYLSLPLQFTSTRNVTVTVFTCDGSALPSVYTVAVPKQGRCRDLIQALSNACSLKSNEKLLLVEVKNHLIQRVMDDPLILLSTIKDDDHLAAYKISKFEKNMIYLRLVQHRREHFAADAETAFGWKPWGTPLMVPVFGGNGIKRGDIQEIVYKMLFPLLKGEEESGQANPSDTSVTAGTLNQHCETGTGDSSTECMMDSSRKVSSSSTPGMSPSLPLQLVDENNAFTDLSVGEEKVIKLSSLSSQSMLLSIQWSAELLERYDVQHLENLPEVCKYGQVSKKARTEPLTLYTCMEAFLREEPLVPEDMWYCPQCKERRQASKKLDLWRLPEVLVIHLKRFSYSRSMKHKLETFVQFPIHDFDLTNYVANMSSSQCQLYELYALINHYGGMGSGHYTAHIKLLDENRWYNFDDSHISLMNEDDVKSTAAYVLFYRRKKSGNISLSNGAQTVGGGHGNIPCPKQI